jgi:hypothetical protein
MENLPLWSMYLIGAVILGIIWWPLAVIFVELCILSLILHMALICPYCYHYGTNTCPSGYGLVATRMFVPNKGGDFKTMFKRYIAIVFPGWLLPLVGGIYLLITDFQYIYLGLFLLFVIDGFLILPLVSRKYGCKKCMNRNNCPWGPK